MGIDVGLIERIEASPYPLARVETEPAAALAMIAPVMREPLKIAVFGRDLSVSDAA